MTTNNLLASINSRIEGIAKSSSAFKSELAMVVRELLAYVPESGDIGSVNRLLQALNKTDRAMTVNFFRNFLPWKYDGVANGGMFTSKSNNRTRVSAMFTNISEWLKNEKNSIWEWQKETRARPVLPIAKQREAIATRIEGAIERALNEKTTDGKKNELRLTPKLILDQVVSAGVSLEDIFEYVNLAFEVRKAEQEKLNKQAAKVEDKQADKKTAAKKAA